MLTPITVSEPAPIWAALNFGQSTSTRPIRPSATPRERPSEPRSPSSAGARSAVAIGCPAAISAETEAGRPARIAHQTPPR